jgi:dTDP-4-amino-4,6-dideoxygalactose transaminase
MNRVFDGQTDHPFFAELLHEPPVPVARSIAPNRELFASYFSQMCETRRFSNFGPLHELLRERLRVHLDAERLGLFANATLALTIALRAHEVSGEVITTPFSFAASAQAIEWAGAVPIFVDVDPATLTIDPNCIEGAITPRTTAILAVHIYGIPCNVDALASIARRHKLALIFDAAHAFDTRIDSVPIHRFGDATIYSTHASKLFHTGEGGILVCNDRAMQRRCERMANFGFDENGDAVLCGSNAKMSELHAATGLSVLPEVGNERAARAALKQRYRSALTEIDNVSLLNPPSGTSDSLQYLAIRISGENSRRTSALRNHVSDRLYLHGVQCRKYFSQLCSEFSYNSRLNGRSGTTLYHAALAAEEVLCLPFHSDVEERTVKAIALLIASATEKV